MRRIFLLAAALLISIGIVRAADMFSQLGATESAVRENLLDAVTTGSVITAMAGKPYHAMPAAAQAKLAEASVAWAKAYTATAAFKQAYAERRAASKPEPTKPEPPPDSQKQIEEMKKAMAALPADQRKQVEDMIKEMQKQLEDPQMKALMAESLKMQQAQNAKDFQTSLATWNTQFPEDPNVLIARRLKTFLDVSGSVDFTAKLEKSGDGMRFAETRYQEKPADWKIYYRAGQPAVAAAQAAVRAWMKELPAVK
jgi:hypothetical protein